MEYVYILHCADGSLYTGCTNDVVRRVREHNAKKGAKSVRGKLPATLVYCEACTDRAHALSREAAIKKLCRREKCALITSALTVPDHLTLSDFQKMEALERACYDEAFIAPAEAARQWYQSYRGSTVAAFFNETLAGFVNLFPVTDAVYKSLLAGTFNDSALTVSDIADTAKAGPVHLFFSCIAVDGAFCGLNLPHFLLRHALLAYAHCTDRIDAVFADTVTPAGAKLMRRLCMTDAGPSAHGTRLFVSDYAAFVRGVHALAAPPVSRRKA